MKIRTNFVTNSSSYSSAEIKIDNPVLLEILQRYREQGAFICKNGDDLGWPIGNTNEEDKYEENPIAIYINDDETANINFAPKNIESVVKAILRLIAYGHLGDLKNRKLYNECKAELEARAGEIQDNYIEVSWEASDDSFGECEVEGKTYWDFYYKK